MSPTPPLIAAAAALLFLASCTATPERVCRHTTSLDGAAAATEGRSQPGASAQGGEAPERRLTAATPVTTSRDAASRDAASGSSADGATGGDDASESADAADATTACLETMRTHARQLGPLWPDVAACFLASSAASDLATCRDVAIASRAHLACQGLDVADSGACVRALRVRMRTEPDADVLVHRCLQASDTPSGCYGAGLE